jgi:predicted Zn-dependent peptidase
VDYLANALVADAFAERSLFDYLNAVASADLESVQNRLKTQLLPEYSALSIIKPAE